MHHPKHQHPRVRTLHSGAKFVAESTKIQHFDPRVLKLSSPKPTPPHFFLIFSKFCKFFCVFNFMNFFGFKFLPLFFIVFQKKFHFFVLKEFLTFFGVQTPPLCASPSYKLLWISDAQAKAQSGMFEQARFPLRSNKNKNTHTHTQRKKKKSLARDRHAKG